MRFAEEVADPSKFAAEQPPEKAGKNAELKAARQLITALSDEFEITDYHDEYREEVLKLIDAKAKGKKIAQPAAAEDRVPTSDLMSALEESLAGLSGEASSRGTRKRGSAGDHKSAAKKHTKRSAR
jgi:DNA end-binding protein Ku